MRILPLRTKIGSGSTVRARGTRLVRDIGADPVDVGV